MNEKMLRVFVTCFLNDKLQLHSYSFEFIVNIKKYILILRPVPR